MEMTHRIFGERLHGEYVERHGAYIVPIRHSMVGVVRSPHGLFLIGGGIEPGESHEQAIMRESLEEVGCNAAVGRKVCSAEGFLLHPIFPRFHPVQTYHLGELSEPVQKPVEPDHELVWIDYEDLKGRLYLEMQNWALEVCWRMRD